MSTSRFTRNFLEANRAIVECRTVLEIYPVWCVYLREFLKALWPQEYMEYNKWVAGQQLCVGLETSNFGELGRFVSETSFSACINTLSRLYQKKNGVVGPICTLRSEGEESYRVVGNVLWDTREFALEWHITKEVDVGALLEA